jgi:cell division protein FtsB
MDGLLEGAYQAKLFPKEGVQQVLQINELIKQKLVAVDTLGSQNTELTVKVEILEAENKLLRDKYSVTDAVLDIIKNENLINDIDVNEIEEISNHTPKPPKEKKLQ